MLHINCVHHIPTDLQISTATQLPTLRHQTSTATTTHFHFSNRNPPPNPNSSTMPSATPYRCSGCDFPNPASHSGACLNNIAYCPKSKGDWFCAKCPNIVRITLGCDKDGVYRCDQCGAAFDAKYKYTPPVRSWSSAERKKGTEYEGR